MSKKIHSLAAIFLLIGCVLAHGQQATDKTFDRLARSGVFAFGGVGFAGVTSQGEKDYRAIMARPTALADFEKILATGSYPAKAYALVGIHILDEKRYKELSAPMHKDPALMTIMQGCVMSRVSFLAVLERIDAGDYANKK